MSEAIEDLSYDPQRQELTVFFHDGSVYTYLQVPPMVFAAFWNVPSRGQYFNYNVRSVYPFVKG